MLRIHAVATDGIDVVVVSYRTPDDLSEFIQSFSKVEDEVPCTLHVVLVDPRDGEREEARMALAWVQSDWHLTLHSHNVGYAAACNGAGRRTADNPHSTIAFFNADTVLWPGVLRSCHDVLHSNPNYAVVGPKQIDDKGRITAAGIFGTNSAPTFDGRWHKQNQAGLYEELRDDCVSVSGSAYFVKRSAWDQLTDCSLYRSEFPDAEGAFLPVQHYCEEEFLSYHARAHGWKVVYNGHATMVHKWHRSSPVGGMVEKVYLPQSRKVFRRACDAHGIEHH